METKIPPGVETEILMSRKRFRATMRIEMHGVGVPNYDNEDVMLEAFVAIAQRLESAGLDPIGMLEEELAGDWDDDEGIVG